MLLLVQQQLLIMKQLKKKAEKFFDIEMFKKVSKRKSSLRITEKGGK